jgi:tRNA-specific 2-thiouridylase
MSNIELNSLGFAKAPHETRVVVAMSGGVDSSVVASLLHEQGYDVVGVTLQLYDYGVALQKKGACCAGQDIYDARRVAEERGFPHYVLNYEDKFKESVMDDFVETYLKGETPIPCVRCNQSVKFRDLLKVARELNADCMATGHYVQRVVNESGIAELQKAVDSTKDQSYFLFATTQDQLEFLRFPLGGWTKDVTRAHADRLGLVNSAKPDSQDICFVPNGDYASVVKKIRPDAAIKGDIIDVSTGAVVGQHEGVIHYTIGQRKGLGIGGGHNDDNSAFYVVKISADEARVYVGSKSMLARDRVFLKDCNWLGDIQNGIQVDVKLRSMTKAMPAHLYVDNDGIYYIELNEPQFGVSPGQAAVCYIRDRVIGGAWIDYTELSSLLTLAA